MKKPSLDPKMDHKTLESQVAHIVAAYAQRPDASIDSIVELAVQLNEKLGAGLQPKRSAATDMAPVASVAPSQTPAVPINEAVTDTKVYCLCCGAGFKTLKRHLKAAHGLDEDAYRKIYGLAEDFPTVAPSYSERRSRVASESGFGKHDRQVVTGATEKV